MLERGGGQAKGGRWDGGHAIGGAGKESAGERMGSHLLTKVVDALAKTLITDSYSPGRQNRKHAQSIVEDKHSCEFMGDSIKQKSKICLQITMNNRTPDKTPWQVNST